MCKRYSQMIVIVYYNVENFLHLWCRHLILWYRFMLVCFFFCIHWGNEPLINEIWKRVNGCVLFTITPDVRQLVIATTTLYRSNECFYYFYFVELLWVQHDAEASNDAQRRKNRFDTKIVLLTLYPFTSHYIHITCTFNYVLPRNATYLPSLTSVET